MANIPPAGASPQKNDATENSAGRGGRGITLQFSVLRAREQFYALLMFGCASVSVVTTAAIVVVLMRESFFHERAFFRQVSIWHFLTDLRWAPQFDDGFGILPLLSGTLMITGIAALIGLPLGLLSAVYLSEYANRSTRKWLKPALELLAGVPTVVYGFLGLVFLTPYVLRPLLQDGLGLEVEQSNCLSAGIVVGVMIVPMISSLSEDVLRAVPRGLREAAYALGATKYEVVTRVVVPSALSGILASFLLAISRSIGETMAVLIAAGARSTIVVNPLNGGSTMTAYIANISGGDAEAGSIEYMSLYAVAMTLFLLTLSLNIVSQWILSRYREAYQ